MEYLLPSPVLGAIRLLNESGFEAYAVGGCVRDLLRGEIPHDYDICTAALPAQMHACFAGHQMIDTGIRHGTVTVLMEGMPLEITAFRTDGEYLDGRHPESVRFTPSLREDLQRRDFTVNAMAYHPERGLIDLFRGRQDLADRVIRCVGDPFARLTEDALRILRALRFAARLEFVIDPETARAMHALRGRLSLVSRERVAEELVQTVQAAGAPEVLSAYRDVLCAALPDYPPEALERGLCALRRLPPGDVVLRMAALLHDCGEPALQNCLDSLRPSRAFSADVLMLARFARHPFAPGDTALSLAQLGEEQLERLLTLQQACGALDERQAAQRRARARAALAANLPLTVQQLPIGGKDLQALGLKGEAIGQTLAGLHRMVLRGEIACDRAAMLAWARREQMK